MSPLCIKFLCSLSLFWTSGSTLWHALIGSVWYSNRYGYWCSSSINQLVSQCIPRFHLPSSLLSTSNPTPNSPLHIPNPNPPLHLLQLPIHIPQRANHNPLPNLDGRPLRTTIIPFSFPLSLQLQFRLPEPEVLVQRADLVLKTTDLSSLLAVEDDVASEAVFDVDEVWVFGAATAAVVFVGGLFGVSFEEAPMVGQK